jgi:hypothetical protein
MYAETTWLKEATLRVLDELPRERIAEVLDFALFIKERETKNGKAAHKAAVPVVPATHLDSLVGLISWGGDALADTERLYDSHG